MFRGQQNKVTCFFYQQHFYLKHQAQILFKIRNLKKNTALQMRDLLNKKYW